MIKKRFLLGFLLVYLAASPAFADEPFELTIQVFGEVGYGYNVYYPPPGNIIKVRGGGHSMPFKVILKNTSSSTQSLNIGGGFGGSSYGGKSGIGLITFEVTDENGNENVVTKKIDVDQSRGESYIYLGPGKAKEFEILLTPTEWNNAFKLMNKGASRLRARASYKSGSTVIYSDYYTILLEA